MSRQRLTFSEMFAIIGDSIAVAAAVEEGRTPPAAALRRLGIDPRNLRTGRL